MRSISVVVIGRNEEALIADCLSSVLAAVEEAGGAEVLFVDSASTDRTVEIARAHGVRVLSLRPEWPLTPAAGRYIGFHHTTGELIMFVDGDTVIERDWLRNAVSYFEQADVAGAAGYLDDVDKQGRLRPYVGKQSPEVRELGTLRGIGLYRRAAMEQAGTFNPHLRSEEEVELCLRLRHAGWKLLHLPIPMGCHQRGTSELQAVWRSWQLDRIASTGTAWRYACRAGTGFRFCFEYLRHTMLFVLVCLLLSPGLFLWWGGQTTLALPFGLGLAAWLCAVALKKRSLLGPLNYAAIHLMMFVGLLAGLFANRLAAPEAYPREADETAYPLENAESALNPRANTAYLEPARSYSESAARVATNLSNVLNRYLRDRSLPFAVLSDFDWIQTTAIIFLQ
jgi:glycosyltransferase involved in cell wall biosynthesis